jgi:hypothetical protein
MVVQSGTQDVIDLNLFEHVYTNVSLFHLNFNEKASIRKVLRSCFLNDLFFHGKNMFFIELCTHIKETST